MKINAAVRLAATKSVAAAKPVAPAFTPEQKEVYQKIETLRKALKFPTSNFYENWSDDPEGPDNEIIHDFVEAVAPVNAFATAAAASGSEAFKKAYPATCDLFLPANAINKRHPRYVKDMAEWCSTHKKPSDPARKYVEYIAKVHPAVLKTWNKSVKALAKEYEPEFSMKVKKVKIDLGPLTVTLKSFDFEWYITSIKKGNSFIVKDKNGGRYTFHTFDKPDAKPASAKLSKLAGRPTFYSYYPPYES